MGATCSGFYVKKSLEFESNDDVLPQVNGLANCICSYNEILFSDKKE